MYFYKFCPNLTQNQKHMLYYKYKVLVLPLKITTQINVKEN